MSKTKTISLLIPLAIFACQNDIEDPAQIATSSTLQNRSAIVGGSPAGVNQFFSTVAMVSPGGSQFCTGTLIAPRVVMTAAHCVQGSSASSMRVVAGRLRTSQASSAERIRVLSATAHPSFISNFSNGNDPTGMGNNADIAVLVLETAITSIPSAPILSVAELDQNISAGTPLIITGYGVTQVGAFQSGTLYIAETPYVRRISSEFVAGGSGQPDTCQGDSGGPVYALVGGTAYVIGATSRGVANSNITCGAGGIYTLAPAYISFLQSASGGLFSDTPTPPPAGGEDCSSCDTSADCAGTCVRYSQGAPGFCTATCTSDAQCGTADHCDTQNGFCVPGVTEQCVQSDVYRVDTCGNTVSLVESCTTGCSAGACTTALAGETCAAATDIAAQTQIIDATLTGYAADQVGSCAGAGPDRFYSFTITEETIFTAEASGFDTVLYLSEGCSNDFVCNDDSDAVGNRGSRISLSLSPGTYVLAADAYNQNVSNFRLRLSFNSNVIAQDSCQSRCGDQAPAGCYCDTSCTRFGDCCGDYAGQCQ